MQKNCKKKFFKIFEFCKKLAKNRYQKIGNFFFFKFARVPWSILSNFCSVKFFPRVRLFWVKKCRSMIFFFFNPILPKLVQFKKIYNPPKLYAFACGKRFPDKKNKKWKRKWLFPAFLFFNVHFWTGWPKHFQIIKISNPLTLH